MFIKETFAQIGAATEFRPPRSFTTFKNQPVCNIHFDVAMGPIEPI